MGIECLNEIVGMPKMSFLPRFIRFIDLKTTAPPPRSNENSTNRSTIEIEMKSLDAISSFSLAPP